MNKELRSYKVATPFETRKLADGTLKIAGYGIRFNEPADSGQGWFEVCDPNMLTRTLHEDGDIRLLREHDTSKLLARVKAGTLQLTVDGQGLRYAATMQPTDVATDTYLNLQAKNLDGSSFGFNCVQDSWSKMPDGTPLRRLLDVDLIELSVVAWPFYGTSTAEARSRAAASKRDDDDDLTGAPADDDDMDDDDEDEDGTETCSCDCRSCRQLRDCANCYSIRCSDRACDGCPMRDESRADALRIAQHFHSRRMNIA